MEDNQAHVIRTQKTDMEENISKSGSDELRNNDHTLPRPIKDTKELDSNEQIKEQTEIVQQTNMSRIPKLRQKFTSTESADMIPKKSHKTFPISNSVLDKLALFEKEDNKGKYDSRLLHNKEEYALKSSAKNNLKQSILKEGIAVQLQRCDINIESVNENNEIASVNNNKVIEKIPGQEKAIIKDRTSKHDALKTQNYHSEKSQNVCLIDEDLSKNSVLDSDSSNRNKSDTCEQEEISGTSSRKTNLASQPKQRPLKRTLSVLERKSVFENNVRVPTMRQLSLNLESKPTQHSRVENSEINSSSEVKLISGNENLKKDIIKETDHNNHKNQDKLKPKIIKEILKTEVYNQGIEGANNLQKNSSKVPETKTHNIHNKAIVEQNGERSKNGCDINKKQNEFIVKREFESNIEHEDTEEINTPNSKESNLYSTTETKIIIPVETPKPETHEASDESLFADLPEKITEFLRKSLQYTETKKRDITKSGERKKPEKTIKVKEVITNIEEGTLSRRDFKPPAINSRRELKRELSVSERIALFETLISASATAPAPHKRPAARTQ